MADGDAGKDTDEWLEFSSSNCEKEEDLFNLCQPETLKTIACNESSEDSGAVVCALVNISTLLKETLPAVNIYDITAASTQLSVDSRGLERWTNQNWIWMKLTSNLNAVRHTKWLGSVIETKCLKVLDVSKENDERLISSITQDDSCQDYFDFHGHLSTDQGESIRKETSGCDRHPKIAATEQDFSRSLNDNLEDLEAIDGELEWSDNDVKDDISLYNTSTLSSTFNQSEAMAELLQLSYQEILQLRNELKEYTKEYSDVLIKELENRDAYIREKELKNNFISSFLSVQEKLRESTVPASKNKFSLQSNNIPSNSQSLVTIPYEIEEEGPSNDVLENLIKIMNAMKINSPNVPNLLTNYILKVLCK